MRNFGISLCIVGLAVAVAGCSVFSPKMTKEKLLSSIKKQVDPDNKLISAKTKVIIGKVDRGSKLPPARMIVKVKHPDKWRMMAIVPKEGIFIRAYDGKVGWEFSTKTGYKELSGAALNELKLQAALAVHRGNYKVIFKSVEFDGEEKIAGELCYKIIAQPKDIYQSQPITFYIEKATFLPFMKQELYDGSKGKFQMTTVWSDYKKQGGVMIPMTRVFEFDSKLIDVTVQSIEWNEYIDDSDFTPPEQF
jgi:Outer membrane lipoprotein-sorting protein